MKCCRQPVVLLATVPGTSIVWVRCRFCLQTWRAVDGKAVPVEMPRRAK